MKLKTLSIATGIWLALTAISQSPLTAPATLIGLTPFSLQFLGGLLGTMFFTALTQYLVKRWTGETIEGPLAHGCALLVASLTLVVGTLAVAGVTGDYMVREQIGLWAPGTQALLLDSARVLVAMPLMGYALNRVILYGGVKLYSVVRG